MTLLVTALRDLAVEAREGRLELTSPGVHEHLLENVDVLTHVVEHVHASRRVIQHEPTHRVLHQGLKLPQGEAVGQVGVGTQERARRGGIDNTRLDEVVPLAKHIKVTLGEHRLIRIGGLEAQGDPELQDALDRSVRRLGEVAGRVCEMTTEQLGNVAGCGEVIGSCTERCRTLIHRVSLLKSG